LLARKFFGNFARKKIVTAKSGNLRKIQDAKELPIFFDPGFTKVCPKQNLPTFTTQKKIENFAEI
jgi:hypothetical protein